MAILNIWVSLMAKLRIVLVAQSCLTHCNPTDCSLPGFSVLEVLQAKILEWIAIPFSRGTSQPRGQTLLSYITGIFFTIWATGKSYLFSRWPRILMAHLNKIGLIQLQKWNNYPVIYLLFWLWNVSTFIRVWGWEI